VESLERFTQNQLIVEEYVSQWLAAIPSDFGRLADVAMLRDVTSGHYRHPALEEVYSESAVHQALLYCHEELFEKVVGTPLDLQEWDLRTHFARMNAPVAEIASRWLEVEHFRCLVPMGIASHLRDLFLSNTRTILIRLIREPVALAATA
jgi:hypothetical protein